MNCRSVQSCYKTQKEFSQKKVLTAFTEKKNLMQITNKEHMASAQSLTTCKGLHSYGEHGQNDK